METDEENLVAMGKRKRKMKLFPGQSDEESDDSNRSQPRRTGSKIVIGDYPSVDLMTTLSDNVSQSRVAISGIESQHCLNMDIERTPGHNNKYLSTDSNSREATANSRLSIANSSTSCSKYMMEDPIAVTSSPAKSK